MRALNVFLALLVSALCFLGIVEGGLRVLGFGPPATINRFDAKTGWAKTPGARAHRSTSEFDVTYRVNALGLRDSTTTSKDKPAGTYRVVCLGDSFTLGYTVDEHDMFVEQLEHAWNLEGRNVDLVNAGTEGWSTDQEVIWFLDQGLAYQPDLVLLFPYENDLYWNGSQSYARFPKPRFQADGALEAATLVDPGPMPWRERSAILRRFAGRAVEPSGIYEVPFEQTKFSLPSGKIGDPPAVAKPGRMPREWAALMVEPPDFMREARARTAGALTALRDACAKANAQLMIVPIPRKAAVEQGALDELRGPVCLRDELWHPNQAVLTFLGLAHELGIPALDPTDALRAVARTPEHLPGESGGDPRGEAPSLYFTRDFHFNARGNLEFARFLHDQLDVAGLRLPVATQPLAHFTPPAERHPAPRWPWVFGGLWLFLTALYYGNYPREPKWQPPLKVAGMLAAIFAIFFGARFLMGLVPPAYGAKLVVLFVLIVLGFVAWKLGRRLGTILELSKAFVLRGHWYLMPLLVVLLSIGSLLVVAASSPLVAPFIYTLF